jgi:hypothetical protein
MTKVIQYIYFIPLLISAILSLKAFRLSWPFQYKTFSVLLFFSIIVETLALIWTRYFHNNYLIYTLAITPIYLLYMAVYYYAITSPVIRKAILVTGILFAIFGILNFLLWQKLLIVNTVSHMVADLIILLLIFIYFEQLKKEQDKENIKLSSNPMVWISLGAFIYHLLSIPFIFSINYMAKNNLSFVQSFYKVYLIVQCIMYILYIKSFLCPHPQQK